MYLYVRVCVCVISRNQPYDSQIPTLGSHLQESPEPPVALSASGPAPVEPETPVIDKGSNAGGDGSNSSPDPNDVDATLVVPSESENLESSKPDGSEQDEPPEPSPKTRKA